VLCSSSAAGAVMLAVTRTLCPAGSVQTMLNRSAYVPSSWSLEHIALMAPREDWILVRTSPDGACWLGTSAAHLACIDSPQSFSTADSQYWVRAGLSSPPRVDDTVVKNDERATISPLAEPFAGSSMYRPEHSKGMSGPTEPAPRAFPRKRSPATNAAIASSTSERMSKPPVGPDRERGKVRLCPPRESTSCCLGL
jgi:hypothetical protein